MKIERNQPIDFDHHWIENIRVNTNSVETRANEISARRSVKKAHQAAWLLKAISCMDLTTLSGDDTEHRVARICAKASRPLSKQLVDDLDIKHLNLTTAAVCVYHEMIPAALKALEGTRIPVAAVSTGFPAGLSPFHLRIQEIKESVELGAQEIDIVISRRLVLEGRWEALYDELRLMREACGQAHIKAILATGELGRFTNIAKASMVAMMAGCDFIKTSTGKEPVNATLPVSIVMLRAIRSFYEKTGNKIGYKPAGGISKAKASLDYLSLIKEELGDEWLSPQLFRFGASSLLGDIERQLDHHIYEGYSVNYRHAVG